MTGQLLLLLAICLAVACVELTWERETVARRIRKKRLLKREDTVMNELARQFIGKECTIEMVNSNFMGYASGVIIEVMDGGIMLERKSGEHELINLDLVVRIRENVKKKKK